MRMVSGGANEREGEREKCVHRKTLRLAGSIFATIFVDLSRVDLDNGVDAKGVRRGSKFDSHL